MQMKSELDSDKRFVVNEKKTSIMITNNECSFKIIKPKIKGLVFSGGGAKGIGYAGAIAALQQKNIISQITHVSGASAGALIASLVAVGIDPDNISKIIQELKLVNLFDNEGQFLAKGERLKNILEIIYVHQIAHHLLLIDENSVSESNKTFYYQIMDKIKNHKELLTSNTNINIDSLEDIIKIEIETLRIIDESFLKLKLEDRITFNDLNQLREILPHDKKHLIKQLSVVTTNQSKHSLEVYNEKNNFDNNIALIVQQSAAHPLLFQTTKNQNNEFIADGGILDNMPAQPLLDDGLFMEEIICLKLIIEKKFENSLKKATNYTPKKVSGLFSQLSDSTMETFIGGRLYSGRAETANREKEFHHYGNMVYLNVGDIKTTTINVSTVQKQKAIENSTRLTKYFLENREPVFTHICLAMLYVGKEELEQMHKLTNDDYSSEEFTKWKNFACKLFEFQEAIAIATKNKKSLNEIPLYFKIIKDTLSLVNLNKKEQKQALKLCLNQVDYLSEGKLSKYLNKQEKDTQYTVKTPWKILKGSAKFLYDPEKQRKKWELKEKTTPIALDMLIFFRKRNKKISSLLLEESSNSDLKPNTK